MAGQPGFFDLDERYQALSASGDPLVRLSQLGTSRNLPVCAAGVIQSPL
jgi:hypothetical protein